MQPRVCASGTIDLDLRQLALEELLEHSHGVILIPRRTMIRMGLELIRIAKKVVHQISWKVLSVQSDGLATVVPPLTEL